MGEEPRKEGLWALTVVYASKTRPPNRDIPNPPAIRQTGSLEDQTLNLFWSKKYDYAELKDYRQQLKDSLIENVNVAKSIHSVIGTLREPEEEQEVLFRRAQDAVLRYATQCYLFCDLIATYFREYEPGVLNVQTVTANRIYFEQRCRGAVSSVIHLQLLAELELSGESSESNEAGRERRLERIRRRHTASSSSQNLSRANSQTASASSSLLDDADPEQLSSSSGAVMSSTHTVPPGTTTTTSGSSSSTTPSTTAAAAAAAAAAAVTTASGNTANTTDKNKSGGAGGKSSAKAAEAAANRGAQNKQTGSGSRPPQQEGAAAAAAAAAATTGGGDPSSQPPPDQQQAAAAGSSSTTNPAAAGGKTSQLPPFNPSFTPSDFRPPLHSSRPNSAAELDAGLGAGAVYHGSQSLPASPGFASLDTTTTTTTTHTKSIPTPSGRGLPSSAATISGQRPIQLSLPADHLLVVGSNFDCPDEHLIIRQPNGDIVPMHYSHFAPAVQIPPEGVLVVFPRQQTITPAPHSLGHPGVPRGYSGPLNIQTRLIPAPLEQPILIKPCVSFGGNFVYSRPASSASNSAFRSVPQTQLLRSNSNIYSGPSSHESGSTQPLSARNNNNRVAFTFSNASENVRSASADGLLAAGRPPFIDLDSGLPVSDGNVRVETGGGGDGDGGDGGDDGGDDGGGGDGDNHADPRDDGGDFPLSSDGARGNPPPPLPPGGPPSGPPGGPPGGPPFPPGQPYSHSQGPPPPPGLSSNLHSHLPYPYPYPRSPVSFDLDVNKFVKTFTGDKIEFAHFETCWSMLERHLVQMGHDHFTLFHYLLKTLSGTPLTKVNTLSANEPTSYQTAWNRLRDHYGSKIPRILSAIEYLYQIPEVKQNSFEKLNDFRHALEHYHDRITQTGASPQDVQFAYEIYHIRITCGNVFREVISKLLTKFKNDAAPAGHDVTWSMLIAELRQKCEQKENELRKPVVTTAASLHGRQSGGGNPGGQAAGGAAGGQKRGGPPRTPKNHGYVAGQPPSGGRQSGGSGGGAQGGIKAGPYQVDNRYVMAHCIFCEVSGNNNLQHYRHQWPRQCQLLKTKPFTWIRDKIYRHKACHICACAHKSGECNLVNNASCLCRYPDCNKKHGPWFHDDLDTRPPPTPPPQPSSGRGRGRRGGGGGQRGRGQGYHAGAAAGAPYPQGYPMQAQGQPGQGLLPPPGSQPGGTWHYQPPAVVGQPLVQPLPPLTQPSFVATPAAAAGVGSTAAGTAAAAAPAATFAGLPSNIRPLPPH